MAGSPARTASRISRAFWYPGALRTSAAGDFLLDAIRAGLNRHESYRKYYSGIRVCLAEFCNDAGVLGAAASARREMEKNPLSFKAE